MLYFEHAIIALIIQVIVGLATRNWWAGAAIASGYFLGREIAQAEYRWIEQFGDGLRANLPWWGALDPRAWARSDQVADWLGPLVINVTVAIAAQIRGKRQTANTLSNTSPNMEKR
jgi:hypothetical protein